MVLFGFLYMQNSKLAVGKIQQDELEKNISLAPTNGNDLFRCVLIDFLQAAIDAQIFFEFSVYHNQKRHTWCVNFIWPVIDSNQGHLHLNAVASRISLGDSIHQWFIVTAYPNFFRLLLIKCKQPKSLIAAPQSTCIQMKFSVRVFNEQLN